MQAIEFQTGISNGVIRMPEQYKNKQYTHARVIVLTDSLIIAVAIENQCSILYSEDMQHNQNIGKLIIKNPFA